MNFGPAAEAGVCFSISQIKSSRQVAELIAKQQRESIVQARISVVHAEDNQPFGKSGYH